MPTRLFVEVPSWQVVVAVVVPTILAWIASRLARKAIAAALRALLRDSVPTTSPLVRTPLRLSGIAVFLLVFGVLIVPAFEMAGVRPPAGVHLQTLAEWAFDSGLRVLLIASMAYVVIRIVSIGVKRFEHDVSFGTGLDALERAKRARTLGSVLKNITTSVVVGIATLMVLREFRVDAETPAVPRVRYLFC